MTDWIETPRTRLRPFEDADAEEAFAWFSDPVVMQYIPRGADTTVEDTQSRIAGYRAHERRFGFSKRLIVHRESGRLMGDAGLFHLPDRHRIELGYRLARSWWAQGYAAEIARTWLDWFQEHRPGETLWADVHAENVRSQRVLMKLGFSCSHLEPILGMPMLIFWHSGRVARERIDLASPRMAVLSRSLPEPPASLPCAPIGLAFRKILPGDAARGFAPSYHYQIMVNGADAGHINLRAGETEHVTYTAGHVGFEVRPSFRGRGYALLACRALAPFARLLRDELIITCDPENTTSRRTIERLGAHYLDEVAVSPDDAQYLRGSRRKLRFVWRP